MPAELTRRRFIARSAVGAAAFAAAAAVPGVHVRASEPSGGAEALRWGIIGTGTRGNFTHVTALNALAPEHGHELLALCDVAEDRLQGATKRATPGKSAIAKYGDYQKLLANADLNAVVIAAPNLLHREMLAAALQAGKHVLCEKPAGVSFDDASQMQRMADGAKTTVMF